MSLHLIIQHFLILCVIRISSTGYISNQRRHGLCRSSEYQCLSRECIQDALLCDGEANCRDNSDETLAVCSHMICPKTTFTCGYGACVSKSSKCNGVRDCYDGSDEMNCNPTANTQYKQSTQYKGKPPALAASRISCLVPNNPANGEYAIGGKEKDYKTGDTVPSFSVLVTNCNYGYQPSPADKVHSVCANGIWTPIPSKCSKHAQATYSEQLQMCECHCPLILIK